MKTNLRGKAYSLAILVLLILFALTANVDSYGYTGSTGSTSSTSSVPVRPGTAYGASTVPGICLNIPVFDKSLCLPPRVMLHTVIGSGREVTHQEVAIDDTSPVNSGMFRDECGWRINFLYYRDGRTEPYKVSRGRLHRSCDGFADALGRARSGTRTYRWGRTCATFMVHGDELARQCHSISR